MTNVSPRVSVVIPAYNNADFIERTVESVLAQTFEDFELVIADHTSPDQTWQLLQRFAVDPRVRLMRTPPGGGAPRNWNRVTQEARGDLVKLVPGDDVLAPTCLEQQVRAMDSSPDVRVVACRRVLVDARGEVLVPARGLPGMVGRVDGRQAVRRSVLRGSNIFGEPACVLLRRRDLQEVGGWDGRFPYLIDQATYSAVLLGGDLYAQEQPLASFRVSAGQWSVALARQQARQAIAFHHWLAQAHPGLLSRRDLAVGDQAARSMAVARRLAYLWLRRRMRARGPAAAGSG